jgi:hypothetical protein
VDVCRRSDRRGRSLVFTCTGEAGADLAARLKRGSRIFKVGVLLGASIEELTIEFGSLLSAEGDVGAVGIVGCADVIDVAAVLGSPFVARAACDDLGCPLG